MEQFRPIHYKMTQQIDNFQKVEKTFEKSKFISYLITNGFNFNVLKMESVGKLQEIERFLNGFNFKEIVNEVKK